MDTRSLLGDYLYDVFCECDSFMSVYDTVNDVIIEINPSMKKTCTESLNGEIEMVYSSETEKFMKLDGIPCRMKLLSRLKDGMSLMSMYPAHTKRWTQTSDLVTLNDITSDGVWEWFPELNFEYMSQRFWDILGYDQKDMDENPTSWMGLLNAEDRDPVMDMCKGHIDSEGEIPYMAKVRYTRSDGEEVIVLCRGAILDWMPDGRPWRILGTHTDITEIIKKDSVKAKTKFISRMSHEIRSPICTILNECELLGDNRKTGVIQDTCKQLIKLSDDLLSIDKVGTDEMELSLESHDIEDVVTKCVKRHRLEAKKQGLKIRTTIDDISGNLMIDLGKFNQVLDNLIGNAMKYSTKGNITLDVEYEQTEQECYIRVTDEGIGMDPSFHTIAFEELVQGDSTMIGAGIGLALCRKLAKLMGGDVTIEKSSVGTGTTMLFVSHLRLVDDDPVDSPPDTSTYLNVLVVDDIETNRVILKRRLQSIRAMGMDITKTVEASNGRDAVAIFKNSGGDFHLVLMDCHMPILDGWDATIQIHQLCSDMGLGPVPIVAVTASVSPDIHDRCRNAGMKYVVIKPFSEMDLMASIQSCINTQKFK